MTCDIEGWYWAVPWEESMVDGGHYPSIVFVIREQGELRVMRGSYPYRPLREWRLLKPVPYQYGRVSNDGMVPP